MFVVITIVTFEKLIFFSYVKGNLEATVEALQDVGTLEEGPFLSYDSMFKFVICPNANGTIEFVFRENEGGFVYAETEKFARLSTIYQDNGWLCLNIGENWFWIVPHTF